jgi:hypothetical protein
MRSEYESIRGVPHRPPANEPTFFGHVPPQYVEHLQLSVELADAARRARGESGGDQPRPPGG